MVLEPQRSLERSPDSGLVINHEDMRHGGNDAACA